MKRKESWTSLALLLAGCAFWLPMATGAEETRILYKCVGEQGAVSIQAKKCPPGSTEAWRRDAQTEPKATDEQLAAARQREAENQQKVRELTVEVQQRLAANAPAPPVYPPTSQLAPGQLPPATDPQAVQAAATDQCQASQNFLASVREKTWIGMTDEQMQRILNWTLEQCRVKTTPAN